MQRFAELFDSDPAQLAEIRRAFRSWLTRLDWTPERVDEIVLAISEGAAIAVLEGDRGSPLGITAEQDDQKLTIEIGFSRTDGPPIDGETGRLLLWVRALMPHVEIDSAKSRTTLRMVTWSGQPAGVPAGGSAAAATRRPDHPRRQAVTLPL